MEPDPALIPDSTNLFLKILNLTYVDKANDMSDMSLEMRNTRPVLYYKNEVM